MVNSEQFSAKKLHKICSVTFILVAYLFALGSSNVSAQSGKLHHYPKPPHKGPVPQTAPVITGSRVYWFSINTNGYGSAPISMISPSANGAQTDQNGDVYVTADSQGNFSISAWNACPGPNTYMYVLATQGDPGTGQNNPYLAIAAIIPTTCGTSWSLDVGETTTVAAAYALSSFATVSTDSFATDSNSVTALQGAVAYSSTLINSANAVIPSGSAWETTLNTVADMLATCIESTGTTACTNLFNTVTPPGGTAPTDTFQAALDIALNPNLDLTSLFNAIPSSPSFQPMLSSVPASWNMPGSSMQITGVTPMPAPAGASVTIVGSGFGTSQGDGVVVIGGIQASVISWSDTTIVVSVPNGAASSGAAQVFGNGYASNQFPFNIGPINIPTIAGLLFSQGAVGMGFVVTGTNFGVVQGASTITLGATPLTVISWGASTITVQIPANAVSGNIVVTVGGAPSFPVTFTVVAVGCN
jgi:hypothetical protein